MGWSRPTSCRRRRSRGFPGRPGRNGTSGSTRRGGEPGPAYRVRRRAPQTEPGADGLARADRSRPRGRDRGRPDPVDDDPDADVHAVSQRRVGACECSARAEPLAEPWTRLAGRSEWGVKALADIARHTAIALASSLRLLPPTGEAATGRRLHLQGRQAERRVAARGRRVGARSRA